MIKRTAALVAVAALLATPAFSQERAQLELVLTPDPEQEVSLPQMFELQAPAVRVGNDIFLGYSGSESGIYASKSCHKFYFLEAGNPIPDDALEFVSVVVGAGSTRGYLWRGPFLRPGPCSGAGPK